MSSNLQERSVRSFPVWPVAVFFLVAVAGLFYVKWDPYFHKALHTAVTHSLGASIISGKSATPPPPSLAAAWSYALAYFKAIWTALVVGLFVGSGVEALLPRKWLGRVFGKAGAKSAILAGLLAIPSMMCTCCTAPVAVGMGKSRVSTGAVLAYWVGNPVLNPATLIFMGFVLGWNWAGLRLATGIGLVALAAFVGNRLGGKEASPVDGLDADPPGGSAEYAPAAVLGRWGSSLGRLAVGILPEYVGIVLLLGAARAWLFPAMDPAFGGSPWLIPAFAIAGTIFVIPTAGEVPIIQTLMHFGLGTGAAGTLLLTLPAVSLPSLVMVGRAVPVRTLAVLVGVVVAAGILTGLVAQFIL